MRRFFEKRHRDAELPFETVPLNFSFRSAPAILAAVDKTFESSEAWRGVAAAGEPPPVHEAIRREMKGVVELWPTVKPADERPTRKTGGCRSTSRRATIRRSFSQAGSRTRSADGFGRIRASAWSTKRPASRDESGQAT